MMIFPDSKSQFQKYVDELDAFIARKELLKKIHPLRYLFWEATRRCNLSCLHCGSDCVKDNATQKDELSPYVITKELENIARQTNPADMTLAIIGGEPLIRQDAVFEVGACSRSLGFHWGITTNGLLLDRSVLKQLKRSGLETISLSLDGMPSQHDHLRQSKGAHTRVTEAIRMLVDDPFWTHFDVICCVSTLTVASIEEFIESLIRLNVPSVRFVPVFSRGRAVKHPELLLDNRKLEHMLSTIAEARRTYNEISINLTEDGYWGPRWERRVRDQFHYCGSGIQIGSILYNGDIIGCPSLAKSFIQGNILNEPFMDVWNQKFKEYRQGRFKLYEKFCANCSHWPLCEGGGLHLLFQENNPDNPCTFKRIQK